MEFIQASNLLSSFYPAAQFLILGSSDSNPGALDISYLKKLVNLLILSFWAMLILLNFTLYFQLCSSSYQKAFPFYSRSYGPWCTCDHYYGTRLH